MKLQVTGKNLDVLNAVGNGVTIFGGSTPTAVTARCNKLGIPAVRRTSPRGTRRG